MTDHPDRFSLRAYARFAGWLYLYTIVTGLFAEFYVAGKLIVSDDPKTTALNIQGSESLFRLGIVNEMLGVAAYVAVSLLLYVLLRQAGRKMALLSVLFATMGNVVWIVGSLYQFAALRLLHAGAQLSAFNTAQVQALILQSLKLHDTALNVGMVFFGLYCLLIGVLIFRSGYFPKSLGVVLVVGGAFDFLNEVVSLTSPTVGTMLPDFLQLPGFIAEVALTVWLIVVGVNTARLEKEHIQ